MQGHSSSMVSTGYWLFCIIQPGLRANFSRESLQPSRLGRRWVVQHPQLTLWDRVRGMQHSLKAGSHLGEGGLCGQGVRWNVPTSIPGPTLRLVPRECPLPIPTNPLPPPPYDSHFPPQAHSGQCGSPKAGLLVASLPVAKSQGTSPHRPAPSAKAGVSKRFNPYVFAGNLRSLSELTV